MGWLKGPQFFKKSTDLFSTKSYTSMCVLWPILGLRFRWKLGIARLVLDSVKKKSCIDCIDLWGSLWPMTYLCGSQMLSEKCSSAKKFEGRAEGPSQRMQKHECPPNVCYPDCNFCMQTILFLHLCLIGHGATMSPVFYPSKLD